MKIDIQTISDYLKPGNDGIWYSGETEKISYAVDSNDECFAIEDNSFWFRHRNACITSIVKQYNTRMDTIFDIGGGNGYVSSGLADAGYDVVIVEPGKKGVINASKRGLENIICATTETARFKNSSLPSIGLFDVIEHIENDLEFLTSIRRLISDGGHIYATVPAYNWLWSYDDIEAGHFRRYTTKSITDTFVSAGFSIEFSTYIFRFLPLPIFLFRSLPRIAGIKKQEKTTKKDHVVQSNIKARLLNKLLDMETNNLENKKNMRFGGSCLIVAKANKS